MIILFFIASSVLVIVLFVEPLAYSLSKRSIIRTVEKKEAITENGNTNYLIFTTINDVLENSDSLIFLKFNSSDYYSQIKAKKTYRMEIAGWRIPFFSMYPNIISFEEIKTNDNEENTDTVNK